MVYFLIPFPNEQFLSTPKNLNSKHGLHYLNKLHLFQASPSVKIQELKVRKFKLLSANLFAKNYHLQWVDGRTIITCKYLMHIFYNIGSGFCGSFSVIPEAPAS